MNAQDIQDRISEARVHIWSDDFMDGNASVASYHGHAGPISYIDDTLDRAGDEIESLRDELTDTKESLDKVNFALREVLDRLLDTERGLVTPDDVISGPCLRNVVSDHWTVKTIRQEVTEWCDSVTDTVTAE